MAIHENSLVRMHYTVKLDNGEVLESSDGCEPLEFTFGGGQIIPGLERQIAEMDPGQERQVTVEPAEAYGERNPEAVVTISKEEFPADEPVSPGMVFQLQRQDGMVMHAQVVEVGDEALTLDLNHPLAGERLHFTVKIEEVKSPA